MCSQLQQYSCHSVCWSTSATASQAVQTSVERHSRIYSCWHRHWHRSSVLHLSRPHLCRTRRPGILEFHINNSAFPSLTPLAQDLPATPASQANVECVFSICGHLTGGKRNRLYKKLANKAFLKVNNKSYDWLHMTVEHCVIHNWNWIWNLKIEIETEIK